MHLLRLGSAALTAVSALFLYPSLAAQTTSFGSPRAVAPSASDIHPPDRNGDGKTDLYVNTPGGTPGSIYTGNGYGPFSSTALPGSWASVNGSLAGALFFLDVNGDGRSDLVFPYGGNYAPGEPHDYLGRLVIALGDGTGSFATTTDLFLGYGTAYYATGDFNHERKNYFCAPGSRSTMMRRFMGRIRSADYA